MRVIIVGYGMAGARLATELRSRDHDIKITTLGAEPHRAYNRILLSNLLAGKVSEADVELAEVAGHGLDVRTDVTVTAVDRAARMVTTSRGDAEEYDHLVLATGSRAWIPPIEGVDPERLPGNVAVFRTLADCRRILAAAAGARTALVLGGGLLGLEAARGLATRGLAVTVLHPVGHLMERQLDPAGGAVLARTLADLGVTVRLDTAATAVDARPGAVTVTTTATTTATTTGTTGEPTAGDTLTADLLVLACGVRPEVFLARAAGLAVERGIVVDDRLRTSDRMISAIGDCAQHGGELSGLVGPAWEQARVLASVLAGGDPLARYRTTPPVTRLKATGIDLAAMGETSCAGPADEELSFADPARGTYAKLIVRGDRLAGAIMLGDNPSVGTVVQLFDRGAPLPADRRALLLGRTIGGAAAPAAQTPALMPDAATVCQCNNVSKGAIVRCWRDGARGMAEVVAGTRATTGCGTCRDAVDGILGWLSTVDASDDAEVARR